MSFLDIFRRKNIDIEAERRERLLQHGRITDGVVIDIGAEETGDPHVIYYNYSVSGVDYESSQTLNDGQQNRPHEYAPGATINVRFDPRQPGNSVVV